MEQIYCLSVITLCALYFIWTTGSLNGYLHDNAINDVAELFEVGLQRVVRRLVVEAADEDLSKDLALRTRLAPLLPRGGPLDVKSGLVEGVRTSLEAGLSLFSGRECDEAETAN